MRTGRTARSRVESSARPAAAASSSTTTNASDATPTVSRASAARQRSRSSRRARIDGTTNEITRAFYHPRDADTSGRQALLAVRPGPVPEGRRVPNVQLVLLPPPDAVRVLEEFRRLHDPAFHRVAAHVPLLPPFDAGDAVLRRFDAFDADGFDVALGAATVVGEALCLPVVRGRDDVVGLLGALASALLPPLAEVPPRTPALRVGLFGGAAEAELARRALATVELTAAWPVRDVTLLVEDVRGLWHLLRNRRLRSRGG
jgi:hypothetical protein